MVRHVLDWFVKDWALKLTALTLAFLLWTTVQADTVHITDAAVPVRVQNVDGDWVVAQSPTPDSLTVRFSGSLRDLMKLVSTRPQVVATFDDVNDSVQVASITHNSVRMPTGMQNVQVMPFTAEVRVVFDRVVTRLIPVAAPVRGSLPPGYELAGDPVVDPSVVRASGPGRNISRVDSLRLPPIDLTGRSSPDTMTLSIDTTGTGLIISPRTVRVVVPVRVALPDTAAIPLTPQRTERGPGG